MASKEMENVIEFLQKMQRTDPRPSAEIMRAGLEQMAAMIQLPENTICESEDAGGIPAEWVSFPETKSDRVILYLHGGGYVAGSINSHRDLCARIANETGLPVLVIDYRLAPENPFPAALEDAVTAYLWLLSDRNFSAGDIIIAGDSAGGGLALATLVKLRDDGISLPRAAVCLSPWTDLAITGESVKTKAKEDPFLTPEGIAYVSGLYLQDADPKNPLASPLYAELSGLPPLLIQVGSRECLLDDSVRFAEKAKAAGVSVTLEVWEEMIHVFHCFAAIAPEGVEGIKKIAMFLEKL